MSTLFSWSDILHIAFSSCLPCITRRSNPSTDTLTNDNGTYDGAVNTVRRARPDELEGLLADVLDTDTEAERMSLHSNPGRTRTNKKSKNKNKKNHPRRRSITFFGYDLFGKPTPPPIHLPESDVESEDGEEAPSHHRHRPKAPTNLATRSSSMTFDSDAAPLDAAAIARISEPTAIAHEERKERDREERRAKRRERRELRRVAEALAAAGASGQDWNLGEGEDEFEGFPGSGGVVVRGGKTTKGTKTNGGVYPSVPSPMFSGHGGGSAQVGGGSASVDVGEDQDVDADLDGGAYARQAVSHGGSGSRSGGESDSRSRTTTSASASQYGPEYNPEYANVRSDTTALGGHIHMEDPPRHKAKSPKAKINSGSKPSKSSSKTKSSKASASTSSTQSHSTSQSPPLASPVSPAFVLPLEAYGEDVDEFEGVVGAPGDGFTGPGFGARDKGGFPSLGLGGGKGRYSGAFLASRE